MVQVSALVAIASFFSVISAAPLPTMNKRQDPPSSMGVAGFLQLDMPGASDGNPTKTGITTTPLPPQENSSQLSTNQQGQEQTNTRSFDLAAYSHSTIFYMSPQPPNASAAITNNNLVERQGGSGNPDSYVNIRQPVFNAKTKEAEIHCITYATNDSGYLGLEKCSDVEMQDKSQTFGYTMGSMSLMPLTKTSSLNRRQYNVGEGKDHFQVIDPNEATSSTPTPTPSVTPDACEQSQSSMSSSSTPSASSTPTPAQLQDDNDLIQDDSLSITFMPASGYFGDAL